MNHGDIAKLRVHERLTGERIAHAATVNISMAGGFDEEWTLVATTGKMPPYGVLSGGRILILVSKSAFPNGDPLGGLVWTTEYRKKFIHQIWVDPATQRRGVGRLLIDAYRRYVDRQPTISGPFSTAGLAFAKKLGAKIVNA